MMRHVRWATSGLVLSAVCIGVPENALAWEPWRRALVFADTVAIVIGLARRPPTTENLV